MMKHNINHSYPCLKTTVEKYSHSDSASDFHDLSPRPGTTYDSVQKLMNNSNLSE